MKKLITAIGIIITITTSTILGTMIVKDMKQSVKEYFNNDVVGGGEYLDSENNNDITEQDSHSDEGIENNKQKSATMDTNDEEVIASKDIAINNLTKEQEDFNSNQYEANGNQVNQEDRNGFNKDYVNNNTVSDNTNTINGNSATISDNRNTINNNTNTVNAETNNTKIKSINADKNTVKANENSATVNNNSDHGDGEPVIVSSNDSQHTTNNGDTNSNTQNSSLKTYLTEKDTTKTVNNYSFDVDESVKPSSNVSDTVQTALNIINPSISISATSAILLDSNTGKVIYHKNATTPIYPASTTKLMTALVALDYCNLSDEVTIGNEINYMAPDSSRAYLSVGQRLTMEMLLEGMLIPSGNDAAYAVAAYVGRVSLHNQRVDEKTAITEFIRLMNQKVSDLKLKNTHFKNPDGYDVQGQYTTAYDMGIIAMEALKNNTLRTITHKTHARNVFLSGEDVTWYSSNKLLDPGSGMYYKYAIGLKTGSSSLAGRCLVSAAEKDSRSYISVIMNSTVAGRWEDSISLLKYGIEHNN